MRDVFNQYGIGKLIVFDKAIMFYHIAFGSHVILKKDYYKELYIESDYQFYPRKLYVELVKYFNGISPRAVELSRIIKRIKTNYAHGLIVYRTPESRIIESFVGELNMMIFAECEYRIIYTDRYSVECVLDYSYHAKLIDITTEIAVKNKGSALSLDTLFSEVY